MACEVYRSDDCCRTDTQCLNGAGHIFSRDLIAIAWLISGTQQASGVPARKAGCMHEIADVKEPAPGVANQGRDGRGDFNTGLNNL